MRSLLFLNALLVVASEASPHRPKPDWHKDKEYWKKRWPGPKPKLYTQPESTTTSTSLSPNSTTPAPTSSAPHSTTSASSTASVSIIPCDNACCSVRNIAASFTNEGSVLPAATPTVPAQLAYECILSVPYNQTAAVALMNSIRPYLNWQTTIQYIKDPPAEYAEKIQPPYDFQAEFDRISAKASESIYDTYANEYEFGFDLYRCFQRTHDGHFVLVPDSIGLIFGFARSTPLVSVSEDGESIPKVYVYADVLEASTSNVTYTPSPLSLINGRNSTEYLLEWSQYGSLQDHDALWNNMFYLLAMVSLGTAGTGPGTFAGGGRGRYIYPGPTTTLTFENGTEVTHENIANVRVDFTNVISGPGLYQEYFAVQALEYAEDYATSMASSASSTSTSLSTSTSSTSSAITTSIPAPGFPTPVVREMNNLNSGYYLHGEGYDDVAVLSVPSFAGTNEDQFAIQAVDTYFIERAARENKTKLIIDISGNAGGNIPQAYDLFKLLFPSVVPYGANRFRAHEALDYIGQETSHFAGLVNRSLSENETTIDLSVSHYNYRTDVDINNENFDSWPDKFGPVSLGPGPDNYTNLFRWNFSDVLITEITAGINVAGYTNRTNITTQHFEAENIVIMTDGYCASTCSIFSELMRQQGGVKAIHMGGRPNKDITQAVGGVKGTYSFSYSGIFDQITIPFAYQYIHSREFYDNTTLADYNDLAQDRTTLSFINGRNGYRQNDTANIPLHFQYEPADCRIYYTPAMAVDQTATWKTVADAAWNGVDWCVAGSLSGPTGYEKEKKKKKKKRESTKKKLHQVRRDINTRDHFEGMKVSSRDVTTGGDCMMAV